MDTLTKELIAIGASVTANCVPCLRYHLTKAQEVGAEETEIQAALRVGRMVRKGASSKWEEEAAAMIGTAASEPKKETTKDCGCN